MERTIILFTQLVVGYWPAIMAGHRFEWLRRRGKKVR